MKSIPELQAELRDLEAEARFHHEQGCFSCCEEYQDKARAVSAELARLQNQRELFKQEVA